MPTTRRLARGELPVVLANSVDSGFTLEHNGPFAAALSPLSVWRHGAPHQPHGGAAAARAYFFMARGERRGGLLDLWGPVWSQGFPKKSSGFLGPGQDVGVPKISKKAQSFRSDTRKSQGFPEKVQGFRGGPRGAGAGVGGLEV